MYKHFLVWHTHGVPMFRSSSYESEAGSHASDVEEGEPVEIAPASVVAASAGVQLSPRVSS